MIGFVKPYVYPDHETFGQTIAEKANIYGSPLVGLPVLNSECLKRKCGEPRRPSEWGWGKYKNFIAIGRKSFKNPVKL